MDNKDKKRLIDVTLLMICVFSSLIGSSNGNNIKKPITYYIEEEMPPGKLIGNLIEDAVLSESYSAEELASLEFKFISSQETHEELFDLTSDGSLLTRMKIDREVLCPTKDECILFLDVEVSPVDYFQVIKINAIILDINDNRPTFQQPSINLSLSESTPVGSALQVPMAYDPDSPTNGIDHYELRSPDNSSGTIFALKTNGDLHGSLGELYLETLRYLDREERSSYALEVIAVERNAPDLKQSVLLIHVSVMDVNDNMPVFSQSKYVVSVLENIEIGTSLIRVTATDLDSSENSQITYSLSSRSVDNYGLKFRVDNLTGEIYSQESLDYEEQNKYTLVLVAVDKKVNGLTGEATVLVHVKDVNDNAPRIRITSLGANPPEVQILEHSDPSTPVAHVSIEDPDQDAGGLVSCSLNDTKFSLTQIYANDFMLRSAEVLDREVTPNFYVAITCKDHGQPELVSRKTIEINVLDINDNRPRFDQEQYSVIISRNIRIGDKVFQLSASDPDEADNGRIRYSILDSPVTQLFSIDEQSGIVRANVDMSNLAVWDWKIRISAEDMADEPLASTTILMLSSLTERPTCKIGFVSLDNVSVVHVEENWPKNVTIGHLFVDSGHSTCDVTTIVYPDEIGNLFVVSRNGEIIAQSSFDRESQDTFCFGVIMTRACRDVTGRDVIVKEYNIQVIVDDRNDNAPIVVFPDAEHQTITLRSGSAEDRLLVAEIKGTDADDGENAELTFSLLDPEEFGYLWLDPDTGELYVVGEVPNDIGSKAVGIKLADRGSPSLSTMTHLWIEVASAPARSGPQVMVDLDSLTKVLSIALPCCVIVVLLIILLVLLVRKGCFCNAPNDRDDVKPASKRTIDDGDLNARDEKLGALYSALGLRPSASVDFLYPEKDLSVNIPDIGEQLTDEKCSDFGFTQVLPDQKPPNTSRAVISRLSPILLSSRDSDSGCSTDMSHSTTTTDSWPANPVSLAWNKDCPERLRYNAQRLDPDRCRSSNVATSGDYGSQDEGAALAGSETGSIRNCADEAYIQPSNVRKYGVGNKRASVPRPDRRICLDTMGRQVSDDKWRRLSDPPNVGAVTCHSELEPGCSWKRSKALYEDFHNQQAPSVYRSLSYTNGLSSNRETRNLNRQAKYSPTRHNDNHYRETDKTNVDFKQKRKVIYEAQV